MGTSPLERDLQQHLGDIARQVNSLPGKVSTIVGESVKYLQNIHSKESVSNKEEVELVKQVLGC